MKERHATKNEIIEKNKKGDQIPDIPSFYDSRVPWIVVNWISKATGNLPSVL